LPSDHQFGRCVERFHDVRHRPQRLAS
jgi:hypothetical protein